MQNQTNNNQTLFHQGKSVTFPKLFSIEECAKINEMVNQKPFAEAMVAGQRANKEVRQSEVQWFKPGSETEWVFKRIFRASMDINQQIYGFDLKFLEDLQIIKYKTGHFFKPHIDMTNHGVTLQKLTVSVQLSNDEDYKGGDLEVIDNTGVKIAPRGIGDAIYYPTYLQHQVHKIIEGERRCLTGWMCGDRPFS